MQAWEVLQFAYGIILRAGMAGVPCGVDVASVKIIMAAMGCDSPEVLELILAAESGFVGAAGKEHSQ